MVANLSADLCKGVASTKILASLNVTTGFVSVLTGLILLVCLTYLKKYQFHTQRLVMYLNVTIVIEGLSSMTQVYPFLNTATRESSIALDYCIASGVVYEYSMLIQLFVILWIGLDMFLTAVFHRDFFPSWKFELVQIISIILTPLFLIWIPFYLNKYGSTGAVCEVTYTIMTTCTIDIVGTILTFAINFAPKVISLVVVIVLYIIMNIKLHQEKNRYSGIYDPHSRDEVETLTKEVRILQAYPLLYFMFEVFPIVYTIVEVNHYHDEVSLVLQGLSIIGLNIQGVVLSLAYAIDSRTCSRMGVSLRKIFGHRGSARSDIIATLSAPPNESSGDSLIHRPQRNYN